jgi:DNA repair protein RadC
MKKLKDLPLDERPREKLLKKGAESLSDQELMAIILGKGSQKNDGLALAKQLIKTIDEKGINIQAQEILDIDGIGEGKATTIAAAFEFVRRQIKPEGLKINKSLNIPSRKRVELIIAVGYRASGELRNKIRNPVEEICSWYGY